MRRTMASIGAAVIMLFLGLIYAWSIFVAPLESEFGWTRGETSLTFTICMSLFCIGGLSASQLRRKLNISVILLVNGIVILIAFLLTSRVNSLVELYVYYGVLCGFSVGCAYNCILSVIPLYFPKRIGLINGGMLLSFGMGGLILGALAKKLITLFEWRTTFVYLGMLFFIAFLAFSFFVRPPKSEERAKGDLKALDDIGATPREMIKHPYFWIFAVWQITVNAMGLSVIGHAASLATEVEVPGALLALAVGVVSAASGVGKFLFGLLYDLKGRAVTMTLSSVIGFVGAIIIYICLKNNSLPLLLIGYFCCGASYGASPACNATFTRKQFGNKYFSTNFAINSMALLIAAFLGTYLIGAVRAGSENYSVPMIILGVYMLVSIVAAQFMKKEKN
jgi:OFA family oxalate/formate antiporter-like MFS transporter